jgi:predicted NUDIX family NTP pyrophosphohydrolase
MFRRGERGIEVLLALPGGPYWHGKDAGAWTIPKGEYQPPEQPLDAALREWAEETGYPASPPFLPLGDAVQKAGKRVTAWAFEGQCDPEQMRCNTFEMEWPPRSGRRQSFPELAEVKWYPVDEARAKVNPAQTVFLDRLLALVP